MGCGASRLHYTNAQRPRLGRPHLRHRIHDLKRRIFTLSSLARRSTTPSKKVLLEDAGRDENNVDEAVVVSATTTASSNNVTSSLKQIHDDKADKKSSTVVDHKPGLRIKINASKKDDVVNVAIAKELDNKEKGDNEENDERSIGYGRELLFPSSPSFRIYCR